MQAHESGANGEIGAAWPRPIAAEALRKQPIVVPAPGKAKPARGPGLRPA